MTPEKKATIEDILIIAETLRRNPMIGLLDPLKAAAIVSQAIWIRTLYPTRTALLS
mgnify:CR=1 FL=1